MMEDKTMEWMEHMEKGMDGQEKNNSVYLVRFLSLNSVFQEGKVV